MVEQGGWITGEDGSWSVQPVAPGTFKTIAETAAFESPVAPSLADIEAARRVVENAEQVGEQCRASWEAVLAGRRVPTGHRVVATLWQQSGPGGRIESLALRSSAPTVWRVDSDEASSLHIDGTKVTLRLATGEVHRLAGRVGLDLDEVWDRSGNSVSLLEVLGQEQRDGRAMLRVRWKRTDRNLAGTLLIDDDTGIIVDQSTEGQARRREIRDLVIEPDFPPLRDDAWPTEATAADPIGSVTILSAQRHSDEMLADWSIEIPGMPSIAAEAPTFDDRAQAVHWARQRGRRVGEYRSGTWIEITDEQP